MYEAQFNSIKINHFPNDDSRLQQQKLPRYTTVCIHIKFPISPPIGEFQAPVDTFRGQ